MRFNKTVIKSLVFAAAITVLPFFAATTTKAAAPQLTFDGVGATIKANGNSNFWGIAKKLKKAPKKRGANHLVKGDAWYQIKNIEAMVGNEVDLSNLRGKAVTIAVGATAELSEANDDKWVIKDIPAGNKKFKAYYSGEQNKVGKITTTPANTPGGEAGYLSLFNDKTQIAVAEFPKVEVKIGTGDWQDGVTYFGGNFANVGKKFNLLIQKGAKISLRMKGSAEAWGSNEVKLAIPAQKKGPSVKLDIVKEISNVKKNVEFKTVNEGDNRPDSFDTAKEKAKISELNIVNDGGEEGKKTQIVYFRNKKVGNKMPSKLSRLVVKKTTKPELVTASANITTQGAQLIDNQVAINLAVVYDVTKGALVTNKSTENDYEVAIGYDGTANDLKWVKLNKTKDAEKPTVIKVAASTSKKSNTFNTDYSTPSKIFIRKPGVKQVGEVVVLPSPAISAELKFTKIEQKVAVTKSAANDFEITDDSGTMKLKFAPAVDKNYTIDAKITNVTKKSGKPKLKVSGAPVGVKVTVDELTEKSADATFNIGINISEKSFKTAPSGTMSFEIEHESAKKKYTVTFAPLTD